MCSEPQKSTKNQRRNNCSQSPGLRAKAPAAGHWLQAELQKLLHFSWTRPQAKLPDTLKDLSVQILSALGSRVGLEENLGIEAGYLLNHFTCKSRTKCRRVSFHSEIKTGLKFRANCLHLLGHIPETQVVERVREAGWWHCLLLGESSCVLRNPSAMLGQSVWDIKFPKEWRERRKKKIPNP